MFDRYFSANDDRDTNERNPYNFEYRLNNVLNDLYEHKFGGRKETIGLLNIGAAMLAVTPFVSTRFTETAASVLSSFPIPFADAAALSEKLVTIGPAVLAASGAYMLAQEVLKKWRKHFLLKNAAETESSISPLKEGQTNGLFFGYTTDDGRLMGLPDENLFRHALIEGQSGMGKTVAASLLMQQQIQRGGGVLFVDGKLDADNLQAIYNFAVWAGRAHDFYVINPGQPFVCKNKDGEIVDVDYNDKAAIAELGLTVHRNSHTYSPILYGDADEVSSRTLSVIPSTETNAGSDYYKQSSKYALTVLVGACKAAGMAYNFMDLAIMMTNDKALLSLESTLKSVNPHCNEYRNLRLFLDQYKTQGKDGSVSLDMKKMKDILGGMAGRMFSFGTGSFGEVLNDYDPEVKLYDCIKNGAIIYVALPTMGKDLAANDFGKILLGDFRTAISWLQRNKKDRPVIPMMCFFDEASSYITESWSVVFEQARSAGVFLLPAVQTDSGMSKISEDFKERVLVNNVTKIFFRMGSPTSSEAAAEIIGKTRRATRSTSFSEGDSSSKNFIQISPQKSHGENVGDGTGEREEEVYLINSDVLRSIRVGECVVSYEGAKVFDLIVPYISFTKEMSAQIGPYVLNFKQKHQRSKGLDFFKNSEKYIAV